MMMPSRGRLILIGAFVVVAAVCVRLAFWQLDRLEERRAINRLAQAARMAPLVVLNHQPGASDSLANRRVRAVGRFDHSRDIVLRARQYQGTPGVEIVTPLLSPDSSAAILVNRGFVPSPDAVTVEPDSLREPGEMVVEGIALPVLSGGGAPLERRGVTSWSRLDLAALRQRLPYPVHSFYIRQTADSGQPRFPRRLEPPALDDGPHLSYTIQWFAFAGIALVFAGIVWRQR